MSAVGACTSFVFPAILIRKCFYLFFIVEPLFTLYKEIFYNILNWLELLSYRNSVYIRTFLSESKMKMLPPMGA